MGTMILPGSSTYVLSPADTVAWRLGGPAHEEVASRVRAACREALARDLGVFAIEVRECDGRLLEVIERRGRIPARRARGPSSGSQPPTGRARRRT